jgi:hypothetical protein
VDPIDVTIDVGGPVQDLAADGTGVVVAWKLWVSRLLPYRRAWLMIKFIIYNKTSEHTLCGARGRGTVGILRLGEVIVG